MEEISAELLENPKTDINAQDYFGITPLMYAAMIGNATTVAALLKKAELDGALTSTVIYSPEDEAEQKENTSIAQGSNALHFACKFGQTVCAQLILNSKLEKQETLPV